MTYRTLNEIHADITTAVEAEDYEAAAKFAEELNKTTEAWKADPFGMTLQRDYSVGRLGIYIVDANGDEIGHTNHPDTTRFMVRASNAHDDLVEALNGLLKKVTEGQHGYYWQEETSRAAAALAKAKEAA